jgi:hypothetical protein
VFCVSTDKENKRTAFEALQQTGCRLDFKPAMLGRPFEEFFGSPATHVIGNTAARTGALANSRLW